MEKRSIKVIVNSFHKKVQLWYPYVDWGYLDGMKYLDVYDCIRQKCLNKYLLFELLDVHSYCLQCTEIYTSPLIRSQDPLSEKCWET